MPQISFRARFCDGHLEPLEDLPLSEGEEVELRLNIGLADAPEPNPTAAGGWAGLLEDPEGFIDLIYESRLRGSRGGVDR